MSESSSNVVLSYSPMDFFYLSAGTDMPSDASCKEMSIEVTDCSIITDPISEVCYQQELCKNKELVENIIRKRDSHAQSDVKLDDTFSQYMNEYLKTINLSVGIILALVYISYNASMRS